MIELLRIRDAKLHEVPPLITFLNSGGVSKAESILKPTSELDENGQPKLKSSIKIEVSYLAAGQRMGRKYYTATEDEFIEALNWGVGEPDNWERLRKLRLNTVLVGINLAHVNGILSSTPAQATLFEE